MPKLRDFLEQTLSAAGLKLLLQSVNGSHDRKTRALNAEMGTIPTLVHEEMAKFIRKQTKVLFESEDLLSGHYQVFYDGSRFKVLPVQSYGAISQVA